MKILCALSVYESTLKWVRKIENNESGAALREMKGSDEKH